MATLYIREYATLPSFAGPVPLAAEPGSDLATVAVGSEADSAAFAATTKYVVV